MSKSSRSICKRKIPFLYEDFIMDEKYEPSVAGGIKIEEGKYELPDELKSFYESLKHTGWSGVEGCSSRSLIVCGPRFNDISKFNAFLAQSNENLNDGGCLVLHGQTSGARKKMIFQNTPAGLHHVIYAVDYMWSRVIPKLGLTEWIYRGINRGHNRNFPRVEVLGRLCRAGFSIAGEDIVGGQYTVVAVKTDNPKSNEKHHNGLVVCLNRIGYHGKTIRVFKLRTMYSYSEYLQKYTYERLGLEKGGKFHDDFRVNLWGKLFRATWIDELPMIVNWMMGDLKLVGVRPLSEQYFRLYTPQMQELRISVKPGLIPPFYYGPKIPETIEEIQENEKTYIESYIKSPFRTDVRYFFGSIKNILFRNRRSR